jgi:hypothetical protein
MSRFKNQERVQVIANPSGYHLKYGTVVETDTASVRVRVDGEGRGMRFWDTELVPAPHAPAPEKELTQTQKYIRELDEDTKLLFDAAGLYPQGTSVQKDLQAFASHQAKIVYNLKLVLSQDGVTLWEAEDGGK